MSNSNDDNASDTPSRIDDLLATIRSGVAADASTDAKASGASACRTLLQGLDPTPSAAPRNGPPTSSPAAVLAGTPIGAALGALGSIPREQMLEFVVSTARSLFAQGEVTYRRPPPPRPVGAAADPPAVPEGTSQANRKRAGKQP